MPSAPCEPRERSPAETASPPFAPTPKLRPSVRSIAAASRHLEVGARAHELRLQLGLEGLALGFHLALERRHAAAPVAEGAQLRHQARVVEPLAHEVGDVAGELRRRAAHVAADRRFDPFDLDLADVREQRLEVGVVERQRDPALEAPRTQRRGAGEQRARDDDEEQRRHRPESDPRRGGDAGGIHHARRIVAAGKRPAERERRGPEHHAQRERRALGIADEGAAPHHRVVEEDAAHEHPRDGAHRERRGRGVEETAERGGRQRAGRIEPQRPEAPRHFPAARGARQPRRARSDADAGTAWEPRGRAASRERRARAAPDGMRATHPCAGRAEQRAAPRARRVRHRNGAAMSNA